MILFADKKYETFSIKAVDNTYTVNTETSKAYFEMLKTEPFDVTLEDENITYKFNTADYSDIKIEEKNGVTVLTFAYVDPMEALKAQIAQMQTQIQAIEKKIYPSQITLIFNVDEPRPKGVFYASDINGTPVMPRAEVDFYGGTADTYQTWLEPYPADFYLSNGTNFLADGDGLIHIVAGQEEYSFTNVHITLSEVLK